MAHTASHLGDMAHRPRYQSAKFNGDGGLEGYSISHDLRAGE
ncbi:MAG: hypothetical protein P8O97_03290 [Gammaproteobacteria bacterium]|nr:hypothetical protein [Gammaproteobacteria bacterium]